MAQTFVNTGTQSGNREDLVDLLRDLNYKKTPLWSLAGRTTATAITHQWVEDTLQTGQVSARAEGFTVTASASDNNIRVPRTNNCEIIARTISVSRTQDVVRKAGVSGSEYDHQLSRKMLVLTLDANRTMWRQTAQSRVADSGTAGQMSGYFDVDTIHTRDAGGSVLSDDIYNALCQEMVEDGVDVDTVFCSGYNKRQISSWATANRRYSDGEKMITDTVQRYEGDWGIQDIIYDKDVPGDTIAVTQKDQLRAAILDPFQHIRLGRTIDGNVGYVVTEFTFEYGARKALGSITNLGNS